MGYQTGGVYIPTSTRVRGRFGQLERLFGEDIKGKAEDAESKAARLKTWSTFLGGGAKGIGTYLGTKGLTKLAGGSLANLLQQGALKGLATSNPLAMAAIIGGPALLSYLGKMAPQALPQYFGRPEDIKEGFEVDGRTSTFRSGEYKDLKGALASQRSFEKEKAFGEIPGDIWSSIKNYGTATAMAGLGERFGGKKELGGKAPKAETAEPTLRKSIQDRFSGIKKSLSDRGVGRVRTEVESTQQIARDVDLAGGLENLGRQRMPTQMQFGRVGSNLADIKAEGALYPRLGYPDIRLPDVDLSGGLENLGRQEMPNVEFGNVGSNLQDMQAEAARLYPKSDVQVGNVGSNLAQMQQDVAAQDYPGFATPFKDSLLGRLFDFSMGDPQYRSGGSNQFHPLNYLSPQEIAARASFKPIDPFVQSAAQRGLDTPAASAVLPTATEVYDPNTDPNVLLNYVGRNKPR